MDPIITLILVLAAGFYMAWNIGANDVANAMGTSIGSKALTWRQAVVIAAILEFLGALLVGTPVAQTIQSGIITPEVFAGAPDLFILGMLSALIGSAIWLHIASTFGWPVSTTHAIVGAIVGFGAIVGGWQGVYWMDVLAIAGSWCMSPLIAGIVAYAIFSAVQRFVLFDPNPVRAARHLAPWIVWGALTVWTLCILFEGLKNLHLDFSFPMALFLGVGIGGIGFLGARWFTRRLVVDQPIVEGTYTPGHVYLVEKARRSLTRLQLNPTDPANQSVESMMAQLSALSGEMAKSIPRVHEPSPYDKVERIFGWLQVLSACFVAFAHGANDVANAIGPVAACLQAAQSGLVGVPSPVPAWLLAFGGTGIVIGLATWGWRVIHTVGAKITELTPTRGFTAEFSAALTILAASKLGMPISTTHALIGAVVGVGLARGLHALNLGTLRQIVGSWIATIPAAAVASVGVFWALQELLPLIKVP